MITTRSGITIPSFRAHPITRDGAEAAATSSRSDCCRWVSEPSCWRRASERKLAWTASAERDTIPTTIAVTITAVMTQNGGVPRRARARWCGEGVVRGRAAGVREGSARFGAGDVRLRAGALMLPPWPLPGGNVRPHAAWRSGRAGCAPALPRLPRAASSSGCRDGRRPGTHASRSGPPRSGRR